VSQTINDIISFAVLTGLFGLIGWIIWFDRRRMDGQ
jgi:hypothetical protein